MRRLCAVPLLAMLLTLALAAPAAAFDRLFDHNEYKLKNRPDVIFLPGPRGGSVHVSPFPMSKRAASIWKSDACFRDCTGQCTFGYTDCIRSVGEDRCRPQMDTCARTCQAECRRRGGPVLELTD
jgi:hypothetical protein